MTVHVLNAKYMASAVRRDQYPVGEMPEVAFIGRSNVGKSSLINSLCRHGGLARISGTPGKTQTLNFYSVAVKVNETDRCGFWLVDLPGYGYARTGRGARHQWTKFIDEYLAGSTRLRLVCQLIDIRHPPMDSDLEAYRRLVELKLPVRIIGTKADKISRMALKKHVGIISTGLKLVPGEEPIAYSAVNGTGRNELLDVVNNILLEW
ncbi:MAG: GTP-binding protein engB [Firmicutes bacterium]|nr:GTP-binding protein engB [Bacillota bacterium]